jgi:rubrerythrin
LKEKNEHITLWILERDRKENRLKIEKEIDRQKEAEKHHCPKCKKGFSEPKLIQYYVCPHCETKFEHEHESETKASGCQHFLGFLSTKDKNQSVPQECAECKLVLECMLNTQASKTAVSQIKKWY